VQRRDTANSPTATELAETVARPNKNLDLFLKAIP